MGKRKVILRHLQIVTPPDSDSLRARRRGVTRFSLNISREILQHDRQLYSQSLLTAGVPLDDPAEFSELISELLFG